MHCFFRKNTVFHIFSPTTWYKEWAKIAFTWQGAPSDTSDVPFNHSARMNRLNTDDADYVDEDDDCEDEDDSNSCYWIQSPGC